MQAKGNDKCEHCKQEILSGQSVVPLHKAVFHSDCLIKWLQIQSSKRTRFADVLRNPV